MVHECFRNPLTHGARRAACLGVALAVCTGLAMMASGCAQPPINPDAGPDNVSRTPAQTPAPQAHASQTPTPLTSASGTPASRTPAAGIEADRIAPTRITRVEGLTEYRWPNGLTALVGSDLSSPSMSLNLVYRVGSRNEGPGEAGMAHLLEHMLFKGTVATPDPKRAFADRAMRFNATTSYDRTNYFAHFTASDENFDWYLSWLADTMANVRITDESLGSERTVVRNEMEQGQNRPSSLLFQELMGAAYRFHPYGRAVIGTESDLEHVQAASLQAFYDLYYRPDNAVIVVTGRIEEARAVAAISESLGRIERPSEPLPVPYTREPVQEGEREAFLRRSGGVPQLAIGYHIPDGAAREQVALTLTAAMLSREPDGPLYQALVREGLADAAYGYAMGLADPGMMVFGVRPAKGVDPARIEKVLHRLLETELPLTQAALERTRDEWLNEARRAIESSESLAMMPTESIAQGDWRLWFAHRDWAQQLTLKDVRDTARRYVLRDNRTTARYQPTADPKRAPASVTSNAQALLAGMTFPSEPAARGDGPVTLDEVTGKSVNGRLANGIDYSIVSRKTRSDRVQIKLQLQWGDLGALDGRWRDADMLDALLPGATRHLDRQQFEDRTRVLDARISVTTGSTGLELSLDVGRENLDPALELAISSIREPVFPADLFRERRNQMLSRLREQGDQPDYVTSDLVRRAAFAYPPNDPRHYRSVETRIQDLESLTLARSEAFYRAFAGTGHGQLAAIGDVDAPALVSRVDQLLAGWKSPVPYARIERPFHPLPVTTEQRTMADKPNLVYVAVQNLAMSEDDPDFAAVALAIQMLGGGSSSRLSARLREQEGLTYSVYGYLSADRRIPNAVVTLRAILAPNNLPRFQKALNEELARAWKDGFTAAELETSRNGWISQRRERLATEAGALSTMASNLYWSSDWARWAQIEERLRQVTPDSAAEAMRRRLDVSRWFVAAAGDLKPAAGAGSTSNTSGTGSPINAGRMTSRLPAAEVATAAALPTTPSPTQGESSGR